MKDTEFLIVEFIDEPDASGRRVVGLWPAGPEEASARAVWRGLEESGRVGERAAALVEVPGPVGRLLAEKHPEVRG